MGALGDRYAGVVLDLDGVCVRGDVAVPGAAEAVAGLRERGVGVAFATNNASRTAEEIASYLAAAGIDARPEEVVTSAQAAAGLLDAGTRCLVIGMRGLREPLAARGCVEVSDPGEADAVVVGIDRQVGYGDLARATRALAAGARFIATNDDATLPVADGIDPGAGAILAALSTASGRRPEIAGKPSPPLFEAAADRLPAGPLLMVGDRVETDIAGAQHLGWDTALVLTGVTSADVAARARPAPTYVLDDVLALLAAVPDSGPTAGAEAEAAAVPDAGPTAGAEAEAAAVVRPATPADDEAVMALWDAAGMLSYTPEPQRDLARSRAAAPDLVVVAERDGKVVGVLLGTCDGRRGWLQRLAVDPAERGRGTGRRLVAEVEARLADRGIGQANLLAFDDNRDAIAFWQALGYRTRPVVMGMRKLGR